MASDFRSSGQHGSGEVSKPYTYLPRGKMKIHPFALMLPEPSGDDRENLMEDIAKHGVKVPVVLFEGAILDGRSRYMIAMKLGRPVPFENFTGNAKNALELVASFNIYRRHLNASQKAMLVVDISERLVSIDGTPKREAVAAATVSVGAAKSTVQRAARIMRDEPKVAEKIRNGQTTVGEHLGRSKNRCPKCGHCW